VDVLHVNDIPVFTIGRQDIERMEQLATLLAASPAETFDQLRQALSGCSELIQDRRYDIMTSKSLSDSSSSSHRHHVTASKPANSSFSIENILSSSPQRRNHGDDRQHQQPDSYRHHLCHQTTDESPTTYHNSIPQTLHAAPLGQALYGRCCIVFVARQHTDARY